MRSKCLAPFVVALILLAPVRSAADTDGDAALAKYRAFIGWTLGDSTTQAIRIAGREADLSTFDEICEPKRFAQFNVGIQSGRAFLVATDSNSVWVSHDGNAKTLPDQLAADELTQSLLLCNAFADYPATLISHVDAQGTNSKSGYSIVLVQPPKAPPLILSINMDTGELTSVVVQDTATYKPAGLKSIDAHKKIYTRWERELPDNSTADMTISQIQLNVSVDQTIFTPQAPDVPPSPDPAPVVKF
jgi:hypothetical protein